jgi:hypothetical protein
MEADSFLSPVTGARQMPARRECADKLNRLWMAAAHCSRG